MSMPGRADRPRMTALLVRLSPPPMPSIWRTCGDPITASSTRSRTAGSAGKSSARKYGPLEVPPLISRHGMSVNMGAAPVLAWRARTMPARSRDPASSVMLDAKGGVDQVAFLERVFGRCVALIEFSRQDLAVARLLPYGHHHASDGVAHGARKRPCLGHEPVDSHDQRNTRNRKVRHNCQRGDQRYESASGHPGGALGSQQHDPQHPERLTEREMDIACLGDEHRRQGQIDGGAIEVERVSGGQYESDHALVAANLFELEQQARQHWFGRRSCEHNQQLLSDIAK